MPGLHTMGEKAIAEERGLSAATSATEGRRACLEEDTLPEVWRPATSAQKGFHRIGFEQWRSGIHGNLFRLPHKTDGARARPQALLLRRPARPETV